MSRFVFHHQDGDLAFDILTAGYCLSPSSEFACSIECAANSRYGYMAAPCFALANLPCGGGLRSEQVFAPPCAANDDDIACGRPIAHLYAGDHYSPWDTRLVVVSVGPTEVLVAGSFLTPDPNYYDARAKTTLVKFEAQLRRREAKGLWWPF